MNQEQAILNYLKPPGRTITAMQALQKFGCFRLASRIRDIKDSGYRIKSEMVYDKKTKKHYSKYSLL